MKKIKVFLLLSNKTKLLFIEAFLLLGWGRILKIIPFSKTAPLLGNRMTETSREVDPNNIKTLKQVSQAVLTMSKYTPWESQCLVRAIAAMKMLEKRKIDSTLYMGIAKSENGKLEAHAWLRSGPFYITGFKGKDRFTVVEMFAKEPCQKLIEGEQTHG